MLNWETSTIQPNADRSVQSSWKGGQPNRTQNILFSQLSFPNRTQKPQPTSLTSTRPYVALQMQFTMLTWMRSRNHFPWNALHGWVYFNGHVNIARSKYLWICFREQIVTSSCRKKLIFNKRLLVSTIVIFNLLQLFRNVWFQFSWHGALFHCCGWTFQI